MADASEPIKASARLDLADASLVFFETAERLGHALIDSSKEFRICLRSVESDPDEPGLGPASPVFQETHLESDDHSVRLMAVGQWRKVHFSAVFLSDFGAPGKLSCGIAARVRQPEPIALASTYTIHATTSDLRAADENHIEVAIPDTGLILSFEAANGSRLLLAEAGRSALRVQILPSSNEPETSTVSASARTVRWDYTLKLVKSATVV